MTDTKPITEGPPGSHATIPETGNTRPTLTIDYARYGHYFKEADITEEQKKAVLDTLWHIVIEFVSFGFNVHPLQQAMTEQTETEAACGKQSTTPSNPTRHKDFVVDSALHQLIEKFISESDLETEQAEEGIEA